MKPFETIDAAVLWVISNASGDCSALAGYAARYRFGRRGYQKCWYDTTFAPTDDQFAQYLVKC